MKKIVLLFLLFNILNAYSLGVILDLNVFSGEEPLDVNLSVTVLEGGGKTRTCWDNNNCGTGNEKPEETKDCTPCVPMDSRPCITTENCPGFQVCNAESQWEETCNDVSADGCPINTPTIFVKQIFPKENITVTQNQAFTFQTKVTCLGADCGDVTATLDPIFGYDQPGNGGDNAYANAMRLSKYTAPENGLVQSMTADFEEGGEVIFVIYSEEGNLLAQSNPVTTANAWITTTSISLEVTAGTNYWLGWMYKGSPPWVLWTAGDAGQGTYINAGTTYPNVPNNLPSMGNKDYKLSVYATYTSFDKGVIPMNAGNPFYTTDQNPTNCLNMLEGETCVNTWSVMPTGSIGGKYDFFVDYVPADAGITAKKTPKLRITIGAGESCVDNDGDTFNAFDPENCYSGTDCLDSNPDVNPGETEACNGIDDNCDGIIDEGCAVCVEDWDCSEWSECQTASPPFVFEWDFEGNGIIDETTNTPNNWLIHSYNAGYYNPKLLVTDRTNKKGEDSKQLSVSLPGGNFPPIAKANGPYITKIGTITLNSNESIDDEFIASYLWEITILKGTPDCSLNNPNLPAPELTCNGIGKIEIKLTVTDNQGAKSTDYTTVEITSSQTEDKINLVKMQVKPEIVKKGEGIEITVRIRNVTAEKQDFDILYEIKSAEPNDTAMPVLLSGNLNAQEIEQYSQKDFVLLISAEDLQNNLKSGENYWIYATATTTGLEENTTFNTRRVTFSYKETLGPIQVNETGFTTIIIILALVLFITTKNKRLKRKEN